MTSRIGNIEIRFETLPIFPFKIGNSAPMTELVNLVVKVTVNGVTGMGRATLANTWCGVELKTMLGVAEWLRQYLLGKEFAHPLGLYNELKPVLTRLVTPTITITERAVQVTFAAYDAAIWDAYGRIHDRPSFQMVTDEHLGPVLDKYYDGKGFGNILRPELAESVTLMYTHGGSGKLLPNAKDPRGLITTFEEEGREVVKIKCTGNWEIDFREVCIVYRLVGGQCDIILDFNGSARSVERVLGFLDMLQQYGKVLLSDIILIEQPFSEEKTLQEKYAVDRIAELCCVGIDESAEPEVVEEAKNCGYGCAVVKPGRGLSHALELARKAHQNSMDVIVGDLTLYKEGFWMNMAFAAYIDVLMAEGNQDSFYIEPTPVQVSDGEVATSHLLGPGLYN